MEFLHSPTLFFVDSGFKSVESGVIQRLRLNEDLAPVFVLAHDEVAFLGDLLELLVVLLEEVAAGDLDIVEPLLDALLVVKVLLAHVFKLLFELRVHALDVLIDHFLQLLLLLGDRILGDHGRRLHLHPKLLDRVRIVPVHIVNPVSKVVLHIVNHDVGVEFETVELRAGLDEGLSEVGLLAVKQVQLLVDLLELGLHLAQNCVDIFNFKLILFVPVQLVLQHIARFLLQLIDFILKVNSVYSVLRFQAHDVVVYLLNLRLQILQEVALFGVVANQINQVVQLAKSVHLRHVYALQSKGFLVDARRLGLRHFEGVLNLDMADLRRLHMIAALHFLWCLIDLIIVNFKAIVLEVNDTCGINFSNSFHVRRQVYRVRDQLFKALVFEEVNI